MAKLVDLIIDSAPARITPPAGLSVDEEQMVEHLVEEYIRPYAEQVAASNGPRSEFRLNKDINKVVETLFKLETFKGSQAKLADARKKAKVLFSDWERLIQYSETLKLLRESSKRLDEEVNSRLS